MGNDAPDLTVRVRGSGGQSPRSYSAVILSIFCILTAASEFITSLWPLIFAFGALLIFWGLDVRAITRGAWVMMSASLFIALAILFDGKLDPDIFEASLKRGAYVTFIVVSLTILQIPSLKSGMMKKLGTSIVNQPPGRRYVVLTLGAHLFGVLLSIGSLSLLGTAAKRSFDGRGSRTLSDIDQIRLKRMTLAILRSFSPLAMWAPTSITLAVIIETFPGMTWSAFLPYGASATVLFLLLGWLFDRLSFPSPRRKHNGPKFTEPLKVFAKVLPIVFGILIFALCMAQLLGTSTIFALALTVPFSAFLWMLAQNVNISRQNVVAITAHQARDAITKSFPELRSEVAIFFATGSMSVMIGPLVNADGYLEQFLLAGVSQNVVLLGVFWIIWVLATIGISPFLTVLLAASTLTHVPSYHLSGEITALALLMAWSGSSGISPFTAGTRLLALSVGRTVNEICFQWNIRFSMFWALMVSVWILLQ